MSVHRSSEHQPFKKEVKRLSEILESKYSKADLKAISRDAEHLTNKEQTSLYQLLNKYEEMFNGTLGTWNGTPYNIKPKDRSEPYHTRPFPVPQIHELTLKSELNHLVKLCVKQVNGSYWAAPKFILPKKDNTVQFISDFCESSIKEFVDNHIRSLRSKICY